MSEEDREIWLKDISPGRLKMVLPEDSWFSMSFATCLSWLSWTVPKPMVLPFFPDTNPFTVPPFL